MNQHHYDDGHGAGTQIVSSQPMGITTLEPFNLSPSNNRFNRKLAAKADMYAAQEHHKARIAQAVIINTIALSAITDRAAEVVPSSESVCREIVYTYAKSSAQRLAESRWF